jgi:short-subunit dehydrogenase
MIRSKAIVITGASSGIGRATAVALGREKACLFLIARREARLVELVNSLRAAGCTAYYQAMDLNNPETPAGMIESALARLGRIDVLINNAAFGYFGSVENTPSAVTREMFEVNFYAPLAAMQKAIPVMRKQGGGHIINVSSVAGKRGLPMSGIYSATKFALNGLSESMRVELADSGIRVSLIHPASTRSEFFVASRLGDVTGEVAPVGHQQTAEDVAEAIVRCIRAPKPDVYPYKPSWFLAWANAFSPRLVDRVIGTAFRDRLGKLKRTENVTS